MKLKNWLAMAVLFPQLSFAAGADRAPADEGSKLLRGVGVGAQYTLFVVSSSYLAVLTHEWGHAAAASAYGAEGIEVEAGLTSGRTTYYPPDGLSRTDDAVISLAGNAVNRLNVGWSNLVLDHALTDGTWSSKWMATFYLGNRAVNVEEWIGGLTNSDADFYKAADSLASDGFGHDAVYATFGLLIAADIWWSWNTIMNNGRRFAGNKAIPENSSTRFMFTPIGGGVGFRFARRF